MTDLELEVARDTFARMAADAIERGQRTGDCEPFSRLASLAFDAAAAFVREHKGREDGESPFVTASYAESLSTEGLKALQNGTLTARSASSVE